MDTKIITKVVFIILTAVSACWAGCSTTKPCDIHGKKQVDEVEVVLKQLNMKTKQLKSYQAQVEYKFIQPAFESTSLRKGELFYKVSGKKSKLRVNFSTLKQDDEKEQKYREEFIFDGIWLAHINYQIKQVRMHQLAEPNKPVGAFELAARNLPIVGFAGIEDLRKQFEIILVDQKEDNRNDFIQLHLIVKPDSKYKDKYTAIDFWIDKKIYLPARVVAISTEEDIYHIKLINPKVNKKLSNDIFDVEIPKGFGKEIIPLKEKDKSKM
ncbi:outer membrane lipoprotein carrier protein LolA [Candidatus Saccharibacteria bacterium]|nr:outer membrane lipoprotein carrier protein LolA [Candidatus Saccharibacteria bacterium]